jgi:hypothetical protein
LMLPRTVELILESYWRGWHRHLSHSLSQSAPHSHSACAPDTKRREREKGTQGVPNASEGPGRSSLGDGRQHSMTRDRRPPVAVVYIQSLSLRPSPRRRRRRRRRAAAHVHPLLLHKQQVQAACAWFQRRREIYPYHSSLASLAMPTF